MRSKTLLIICLFASVLAAAPLFMNAALADDGPEAASKGSSEATAEAKAKAKADPAPRPGKAAEDIRRVRVEYRGLLQDENDDPISGVFALDFKIYDRSMSVAPLWSERHFVAVVGGEYIAPLGSSRNLMTTHIDGERWIGIELVGEGEILRDRLVIREPTAALPAAAAGPGARVAFSDVADRAIEADRARVAESAERLGDLTLGEIERLSNLALERLGEHIADPNAHQGGGRAARSGPSSERRVMESIGGRGGGPYDVRCPPGFVVTGIEGTAGRVLDSIRIVCSPMQ